LVGVIIGVSVVFLFARLLIMAVGRAARRVVLEVRNQFRTHPASWTNREARLQQVGRYRHQGFAV